MKKTDIDMNAEFLVIEDSKINKKSIKEFESTFKGVKLNYIIMEGNKKIVGKNITKNFILKAPFMINISGPLPLVTKTASLI